MFKTKGKTALNARARGLLIGIALLLFLSITAIVFLPTGAISSSAAGIEDIDSYNFTVVTNSDGERSYSVAIKASAKPTLETAIIPDTYNGLPVTEIANNGFMSCANLKKVVLPTTIKKIGNNAFMNCAKLERVGLPSIEAIGMNAFAMCPLLDRVYLPNSLKTVGANILRNNANTVFVQSSAEEVSSTWQSTWNSYYTGEIIYGIAPEDTVGYREILDEQSNIIGYEVSEYQYITSEDADIIIYNSFRPDENSAYLPVLNICSEAFTFSQANSITIKDRHTEDAAAPIMTHSINIRSNAFLAFLGNEMRFEVSVTFDHPAGLQNTAESMFDASPIIGDANNKSIKILEESTVKSVTLPSDISIIPERMFYNCPYLESIKILGEEYSGTNVLGGIQKIGTGAFSSCISLSNITIPSSVTEVGEAAFYAWGNGTIPQTINIDFYEGYTPDGWVEKWFEGNADNTAILYKALTNIEIDWQDDVGTKQTVGVKPDLEMPTVTLPQNVGYVFKGIYSQQNGNGLQYYTNELEVNRIWTDGDPTTLYAYWEVITYNINYPAELNGYISTNPATYTVKDEVVLAPIEYGAFIYTFTPNIIERGTTGDITPTPTITPKKYNIRYETDYKGNDNPNPSQYDITDNIVFENLVCEGYSFSWSPASIPVGSTDDIVVVGTWTPNQYPIHYSISMEATHSNPATYTYGLELVLSPATRGGYFVTWDRTSIPAGTIGEVTVNATYTEKTLDQCYNNGVYEIWTLGQLEGIHDHPNGGYGRTYRVMKNIAVYEYVIRYWLPIPEFKGTLDGNGYNVYGYLLDKTITENYGFCQINSGRIKNLTLGVRFSIYREYSNINVGSFAGINKGFISNCSVMASGGRPCFTSYAKGDSFMGGFVGVNEGTIEDCYGGDCLMGSCNMGAVAGKNSGTIKNCNIGHDVMYIDYDYEDYNACVGGIVGLQTGGSVTNCKFKGKINWTSNYRSTNYPTRSDNREMQPCIGIIIGYKQGGSTSGNTWQKKYGSEKYDIVFTYVEPCVITWETGALWWKEKHTHDQGLYFKNEECGRV